MTRLLLRIAAPIILATFASAESPELRISASTAYLEPDRGARVSSRSGVTDWRSEETRVLWFGEIKRAAKFDASVAVRVPEKSNATFKLTIGGETHEATSTGGESVLKFGTYAIAKPGYARFELSSNAKDGAPLGVDALVLAGLKDGDAHFNVEPRRNAASVHLRYPVPKDTNVAVFYNEMTGVDDPTATYYMACGFSRGYFGMQVNSPTERRIIFSVWDAASGQDANDRSTVEAENHTQLITKGEGVHASVFGNEGTGGHSHLKYNWKTGSTQRFAVAVKPDGTFTNYSGWWFHPEEKKWMLIASFRAPKDGKWLRGLYSFSENFGGSNGHLRRKALYGPQWIRTDKGEWLELTETSFSHDPTGKTARLDRFMGVEGGRFFLSHGGFVEGFTKSGETFTRPATGKPPTDLPEIP